MEVQADVQKERCSLSGESATVSLGTISDNASTKAMAGSILSAYMPLERSAVIHIPLVYLCFQSYEKNPCLGFFLYLLLELLATIWVHCFKLRSLCVLVFIVQENDA